MSAIFLSASVPVEGREGYGTGDAYLIREAVSAFIEVVLGRRKIVWGGHPAITPMVWHAAESLGISYSRNVRLFQSLYFEDRFPEDNARFGNTRFIDAVVGDKDASLLRMRREMLNSENFEAAVFVGGMEGLRAEYALFRERWPNASIVALPSPGGVARELYKEVKLPGEMEHALDFSAWLYDLLRIRADERRVDGLYREDE